MVERTVSLGMMAGSEISAIKETLHAQQELLHKLNQELDAEREASSTAASEALSMILRLQGEKAALKMEASQYKRMSEEKMCHAETSLAFFEDLIYQKEIETAFLEFQVKAYRCKLLSLGCNDAAVAENKFPESLMLQTNDAFFDETTIRRLQSLALFRIDDVKNEESPGNDLDPVIADKEVIDESLDHKKGQEDSASPPGDLDFYWEQIKKIDERVREISDSRDSCTLFSQMSNTLLESTRSDTCSEIEKMKTPEKYKVKEASTDVPSSSTKVQDTFKVLQTKDHTMTSIGEEERSEKQGKDERECLKTLLSEMNQLGRKSSKPPREIGIRKDNRLRVNIGTTEYQTELQQMKERVERLESRRCEVSEERKAEEIDFLREIHEKLNLILSEVRNLRPTLKQTHSRNLDYLSLNVIQEAMIHFWS